MRLYVVGGAVRDRMLGEPVHDRDWVAVGATPEQLLAAGYTPVGKDFPVFLHPRTGEEVALARTERKSGRGYHGFTFHTAPDVTLEEDLARRDLTINAMAEAEDGAVIDPFGGQQDLEHGVLRHVSPAFAEDPVRLLRLARFAARWPHFTVAPETQQLLQQLVQQGEVDALVPERVWQELSRGLMARRPSRMFNVLAECGALPRLLAEPTLDAKALADLDRAAGAAARSGTCGDCGNVGTVDHGPLPAPLPVRFALLGWRSENDVHRAATRLRTPNEVHELAALHARLGDALSRWLRPGTPWPSVATAHAQTTDAAQALLSLFEQGDALRRPERFDALVMAGDMALAGYPGCSTRALAERGAWVRELLRHALDADTAAAAAEAQRAGAKAQQIGQAVRQARLTALRRGWPHFPSSADTAGAAHSADSPLAGSGHATIGARGTSP